MIQASYDSIQSWYKSVEPDWNWVKAVMGKTTYGPDQLSSKSVMVQINYGPDQLWPRPVMVQTSYDPDH